MSVVHSSMPSSECHEPKNFSTALTTDAGKVNTPSSTVAGVSTLRNLASSEVLAAVGTLIPTANVASPVSSIDYYAISLTADTTINNPTGTGWYGQTMEIMAIQDASGGHDISWGANFIFSDGLPVPNKSPNAVNTYKFSYAAGYNVWHCISKPQDKLYAGKTSTANTNTIAVTASSDPAILTDYEAVPAASFDSPDVAPANGIQVDTDGFTVPYTGVYFLAIHLTGHNTGGTTNGKVFHNLSVNGTISADRPLVLAVDGANDEVHGSAFAHISLTAGDVIKFAVAGTDSGNVVLDIQRVSIELIKRTA